MCARYQRWAVRLPSLTLAQLTQVALSDGWQLSDFLRTLVVFAAVTTWLGLESEENLWILRNRAALGQISDTVGKMLPAIKHRRPYAPRRAQDTDVIKLILPTGLARLIESYADAHRFSKSELCGNLLEKGLMIYMTGEKNLLESVVRLDRSSEGVVA